MGLFGFGKKKKDIQESTEGQAQQGFLGFVLLSTPEWDKAQLLKDIKDDWGIDISESEEEASKEEYKDILVAGVGGMNLAVSFMPMPVPNGEAEYNAASNYMWRDAVEVTKTHQAQIVVAVLGGDASKIEQGRLLTKAISACLKQKNAIAVYTDGAVFQPEFYCDAAQMLKDDGLALLNWVWFGIYRDAHKAGIYTYGMRKFDKDEMEVYVDIKKADLNDIRNFMLDMVAYVLEADVTLRDGETIGFTEEQKLPITRSKGIALDGQTLKIAYEV